MRSAFVALLLALLASPAMASDIPEWDRASLKIEVSDAVAELKAWLPEFELVTGERDFEPLSGKRMFTMDVDFPEAAQGFFPPRLAEPPTYATIHERGTGRPIASCAAPCSLSFPSGQAGLVVFAREGSAPLPQPAIESQTQAFALKSRRQFHLGYNAYDAAAHRKVCLAEAEAQRISDPSARDAELRMGFGVRLPRSGGHCEMQYSIEADGRTADVVATRCTDTAFCESFALSVARRHYASKVSGGVFVRTPLVEETLPNRPGGNGAADLVPCVGAA